uniref:Docking protein 1 n=1 Tax=Latimeria chalumnae TaxID=7897 RepID=H3AZC4_LATCH
QKWKKNWFVLYPASQYGIARLEFYDCKESNNMAEKPNTKKLDKKIIRLAECISIVPDLTEACPKDNMLAFCIETNEKCFTFATEKQAAGEWVDRLCEIAFQSFSWTTRPPEQPPNKPVSLEMSENSIYYSRTWNGNHDGITSSLQKPHRTCKMSITVVICKSAMVLEFVGTQARTHHMEAVTSIPFGLLRHSSSPLVMFSFEAGRRCESGPGNFTFETKQGNEIFQIVEASIKQQKAQAEENRKSYPSLDSDSAFPLLKNASVESTLAGRVPPPPNLYSEPLDSVKAQKPKADSLYSDPVDTVPASKPLNLLRLKHCSEEEKPPAPLYSDLYERVTYDLAVTTGSTKTGGEEHIYDEPEGRAPHPLPPLSSIYDEARPSGNAWRKQAQADQVGHEVPYNPKTDDYSVPPWKGPKPLTAPKPQVLPRHIDNKDNYTRANVNSSNNNNSALYSKVMK